MKKVLSLILVMILGVSIVAYAKNEPPYSEEREQYYKEFEDFSKVYSWSDWATDYIRKFYDYNMLDERLSTDFTLNITREQFCIMAVKVLDECGFEVYFEYFDYEPFSDTKSYEAAYLYQLGIINGKGDSVFDPRGLITREEAACIMTRAITTLTEAGFIPKKEDRAIDDWAYTDHKDISSWAIDSVYYVSQIGIMTGTGTGFEPKGNLTNEQAVVILLRLFDLCEKPTVQESFDITFADDLNALMIGEENYMFSPLSIKIAFALLANGADEEVKEEILEVLGIEDLEDFNLYVDELMNVYKKSEAIDINIANSIWINKELTKNEFDGDFEFIATEYYSADVGKVVQSNGLDTINGWVTDKTEGKIERIISRVDFLAALINATYFKGTWLKEFDEDNTSPDIFYNIDNSETETDFMYQKSYFNYCETKNAKIIELPYESDVFTLSDGEKTRLDISMYLLLPDEEINVINELDMAQRSLKSEMVELTMPKFEITYSMDLTEYLEPLGMEKVFSEGLPYLVEYEEMFVNRAVHKAYINVNEKDTEAAAVTMIGVGGSAWPSEEEKVIELKFDKPFYFAVRDNITGEVLFMGRYVTAE